MSQSGTPIYRQAMTPSGRGDTLANRSAVQAETASKGLFRAAGTPELLARQRGQALPVRNQRRQPHPPGKIIAQIPRRNLHDAFKQIMTIPVWRQQFCQHFNDTWTVVNEMQASATAIDPGHTPSELKRTFIASPQRHPDRFARFQTQASAGISTANADVARGAATPTSVRAVAQNVDRQVIGNTLMTPPIGVV